MKKLFLLFSITLLSLTACMKNRTEDLNIEQVAKEKAKVLEVIKYYNTASNDKSFSRLIETLSEDVVFFGSDSSEVIHSLNDFKGMIQSQWEHFDIQYGEMVDTWIEIDPSGTLASVIYGLPGTINMKNGEKQHVFFRISRTLGKRDGKWLIISGIVSITSDTPTPEPAPVADSTATKK